MLQTKKLRLTALVTNYNHGRYLPVAVDAIVRQSRPADELILIDDASTDGSQCIVDKIAQRYPAIKVVKHQVNRGVNPSGQEALEMATGDYFYWGSADDMVLPGFFESAMSLLEKFPYAAICAGVPILWREETDQQFRTCGNMPKEPQFLTPEMLRPLARSGALDLGGAWAFYRVNKLKELGGFPASLKWFADWFTIHALTLGSGLAWTAQPTAVMRFHRNSYSGAGVNRLSENNPVLAELARLVVTVIPSGMRDGYRESGILGRLGWPMLRVLLAERHYRSHLSLAFWIVWIRALEFKFRARAARAILPTKLRLAMWRKIRAETRFDLSVMKTNKLV